MLRAMCHVATCAQRLRDRSCTSVCSSLRYLRRRRRSWHIMRMMINMKVSQYPVLAIAIAQCITDRKLAELLASSFAPPSSSRGSVTSVTATGTFALPPAELATSADIRSLYEEDLSHTESQRVLFKRCKRSCGPGPDRITHQMLRNLDASQHPFLLDAFNSVFSCAVHPDQWRSATVTPVFKQGEPPHSVKSYRPLSVTSVAGKAMEENALYRLQ
ncbi:hypothetical protein HPB51_027077 [Rhipicephalus microplus]|uniref:Tick transposon n=1 Tax=Rhipicephalus microplus TaxID=6941 RepID=A0A9J6D147_RHIMP|nr:hypothetical protein HPB51_027077 [Rhipicephalus microplus]